MKAFRILSLILLLGIVALMALPVAVFAADDNTTATEPPPPPPPPEKIEITPTYPKLEAVAGGTFAFESGLTYSGQNPRVFDFRTTAPKDWDVAVTPQYEKDKRIQSIRLQPSFGSPTTVAIAVTSPGYPLPDPGNYKITVQVTSGNITASTDLTAVITAKYALNIIPASASQLYNTTVTAGQDNAFSIKAQNAGTAPISNVTLSSTKPDGWTVTFKPEKLDALQPFADQTIDVTIKPPAKAIAGDYVISLTGSGKEASATKLDVRITVESPTIWGWVGVGIIVVVVAGLVITFMRFSRR